MVARPAALIGGALAGALAEADLNRRPPRAQRERFKQWVHATVATPELALVANFSTSFATGAPAHRLTTLVFGDGVAGHSRAVPADACAVVPGRSAIRLGDSAIAPTAAGYALVVVEPRLALTAELELAPRAAASTLHNLRFAGGDVLHWSVVPRMVANGTITYAGRRHAVVDAPAYRDRNWGALRFGDVAWDWGYALADDPGSPFAIVFARLLDAARTRVVEQELLIWSGATLLASFRGAELEVVATGAARGPFPTVPAALALCRPGHASDVPEQLAITAASARGTIRVAFERLATARIVVPDDAGVGTTAIYESLGRIAVSGSADGCAVALTGRGFLECVHA